jgi:hypothetical protein
VTANGDTVFKILTVNPIRELGNITVNQLGTTRILKEDGFETEQV